MNNASWRIDFGRLGMLLMPSFLRGVVWGKYVRVAMGGVAKIHTALCGYRDETAYELRMSGQVCRLRCLLNDAFDGDRRRIKIEDVVQEPTGTMVKLRKLNEGLLLGKRGDSGGLKISCRGYSGIAQPDFAVVIPGDVVVGDMRKLSALLSGHKLAGKRFVIIKLI